MILRLFIFLSISFIFLYAESSMAQIQQAIQQNPALLNTPQAQDMLRNKGLATVEVKTDKKTISQTAENNISIIDNLEKDITTADLNQTDINKTVTNKRVNPFSYKSNQETTEELDSKQQSLVAGKLSRYSKNFYANKNIIDSASLPTPDDYIISTGDSINVHIYGDRDKEYILDVKNDGTVDIEFIGPVKIGSMKYLDAKKYLLDRLQNHFKMSNFNISMNTYSTIQVTLVGEVKAPGVYNLSSFSTVKDLLTSANGTQDSASVRDIIIKRNSKIIAHIDLYNLLFKGESPEMVLLKHGDVVIIKKANKLVSIDGYINNASIFELTENENLYELIEYAGGMKPDASKLNIKIDRFSNNSVIETFNISYDKSKEFKIKDGDQVYIHPLDFTANKSVNIYGNIIRPGSYRIGTDNTLNALFKDVLKDGAKKFFLPQTYFEYGVIKRYSDDLTYETKSFNLNKVLAGSEVIELSEQDKIFIFSQSDIYLNAYITTSGIMFTNPGKLQYYTGMTIQDAIYASGVNGPIEDKVRVTTYNTEDLMPKTTFYSIKEQGNTKLSAYDEVEIYDYYKAHILEPVSVKGEVVNPTTIYYERGMTLEDLLVVSGGLTRMAYTNKVEIVRFFIDEEQTRQKKIIEIDLNTVATKDVKLEAYDDVTIFKIPKWNEKKTIEVRGQVRFPGIYTISTGEKLSDVLKRAGGFTEEAFIEGAVFTRDSVKQNQREQYSRALANIKKDLAIYNAMPANSKTSTAQASGSLNEVILEAAKYEPIGRVGIDLINDIDKFENSPYNISLQDKDTITIPSTIDTVTVFGEVFNPSSYVYNSEIYGEDYISLASGLSRSADKDSIYVIHANGASEPLHNGMFGKKIKIRKGDTIIVPLHIKEYDNITVADSIAKILASFALTVAAMNSLGVF